YDKPAAQKLMQEAGFGPNKKLTVKIQTSASGSGQMLPLPMNEFLQQSFKEIGIDIDFKVVELETLYSHWRKGAADEMNT
ncbi:ABC transporter substrate-binding protein, partial [Bradyrhizobium uaiense]